jgi:signal transduction protein with GAF and PtsI domain
MNENYTFQEFINIGHRLLSNNQFEQFEDGLSLISDHLTDITGAERCSIFIYEKKSDELWTILSTGIEKIHVPSEKGIVGYVFRTENSQSGYKTHNIIACPIYNSKKELIGVLELLNKLSGFDEDDLEFLNIYANYIGSIIELAPFYFRN